MLRRFRRPAVSLRERARWRVARLVGRIPRQCWTDLVDWALASPLDRREEGRWPWRPITRLCRADAACGGCYCGALGSCPGGDHTC